MNRSTSSRPHPANGGRGNIELNIDELVIRGVSPRDRQRIVQEIEQELARLLQEGGMPPASGTPATKGLSEVSTKSQGAKNDSVARQVARNVYQSLGTGG
jgi:hypothetical protein